MAPLSQIGECARYVQCTRRPICIGREETAHAHLRAETPAGELFADMKERGGQESPAGRG